MSLSTSSSRRPRIDFALRAYATDGHPAEVGSEAHWRDWLARLVEATAEMARVLKPEGSIFVNLGDKYATTLHSYNYRDPGTYARKTPQPNGEWSKEGWLGKTEPLATACDPGDIPPKSLMLLPERYRIACVDQLGLTARAVICWQKLNGLPESVKDRVRRSHEDWVHLVKQPRYYAALDELREPHQPSPASQARYERNHPWIGRGNESGDGVIHRAFATEPKGFNPLGKLPGSVWSISSEPLDLPGYFVTQDGVLRDWLAPGSPARRPGRNGGGLFDADAYTELVGGDDGPAWRWLRAHPHAGASPWPRNDAGLQLRVGESHYAAFPSRWPEQLIKGWSPPGICTVCGQGRFPVVERQQEVTQHALTATYKAIGDNRRSHVADRKRESATILGYACACTPSTLHPGTGEPSGEYGRYAEAQAAGVYANTADGLGHAGLSARPKVGPWWEYHLAGWQAPPTRPAVVLDPFAGTFTTVMVAHALDRIGIGVDLSASYCRLGAWRTRHSGHAGKAIARTNQERQGTLL